jgi:tetratricopeptide (TPR) repeat protein
LKEILEAPGRWILRMLRKTALLFNGYEIPLDYNYDFFRSRSPFFRVPWPGFTLLFALASAGLVFAAQDRRVPWTALLYFGAGAAATILFFVTSRYRLPLLPPLLLLAGAGVGQGARAILRLRLPRLALALAAASAALAVALYPVERGDFAGSWRHLGDALRKDGQLTGALEAYGRSLEIRETSATWNNKGNTLLNLKGADGAPGAAEAYRAAIRLDPGNREAWNNLGVACKKAGDVLEAESVFEQAISRFPGYVLPVENLARLYREQGEAEAALALIRRLAKALEDRGERTQALSLRERWGLGGVRR